MPELPEVETVCRGLRPKLAGQRIAQVTFHRPNLRFPLPKKLPSIAKGQRIKAVKRLSKYILMNLENGGGILLHLGMSGRLYFHDAKTYQRQKHDHVVITLERGPLLVFNDARRFGVLDYIPPNKTHKLLTTIGMDPFDKKLTPQWLHGKAARLKCDLKAFLMNQKIIAGLGNIYVSEALFRAGLWPKRKANTLTIAECKKLIPAIRAVLDAAIKAGGSSLHDYVQADGELGSFQNRFKVYDRDGSPCPSCRQAIVRFVQAGRSSYGCKTCQK